MKHYKSLYESYKNYDVLLDTFRRTKEKSLVIYGYLNEVDENNNVVVINGDPFKRERNELSSYAISLTNDINDLQNIKFLLLRFPPNKEGKKPKLE